jgi:outer membrane translocation and assembly module TamA
MIEDDDAGLNVADGHQKNQLDYIDGKSVSQKQLKQKAKETLTFKHSLISSVITPNPML